MLAVLSVVVMDTFADGWLFYIQHQLEEMRRYRYDSCYLHVASLVADPSMCCCNMCCCDRA